MSLFCRYVFVWGSAFLVFSGALSPFYMPLSSPAFAQETSSTETSSTGAESGSSDQGSSQNCGFDDFKKAMGFSEGGGSYTITNKKYNYLGKYQFGEAALNSIGWYSDKSLACGQCWQDFSGVWTGEAATKYNIKSAQDFLNNGPAQERAFELWMAYLYKATRSCHNYIGQDAPKGGCKVTLSGILGAAHLGGPGGVCKHLRTGGAYNPSDGHTRISDYLCKFAGFDMPFDDANTAEACNLNVTSSGEPSPTTADTGNHYELLDDAIKHLWIAAFMLMTEQLTATMLDQVEIIGSFFDAKHQLETQRIFQQRTAQAHKDYHPGEQMCEIGTFVRNLSDTQRRADMTTAVMAENLQQRALSSGSSATVEGQVSDMNGRLEIFIQRYCRKTDNNSGLNLLCMKQEDGKARPEDANRDVDFTGLLDVPLTLDVDFLDDEVSPEETSLFMLMDHLFLNRPVPRLMSPEIATTVPGSRVLQDLRAVAAMRSLAANSFANMIAMKTAGPDHLSNAGPYLKALMRDFGLDDTEIEAFVGENPSYYAQMEFLTKKIYQHPKFIANLYDKPENVHRLRAAMRAIELMQDRDIHDALMRREMLMSAILEVRLRKEANKVYGNVNKLPLDGDDGATGSN